MRKAIEWNHLTNLLTRLIEKTKLCKLETNASTDCPYLLLFHVLKRVFSFTLNQRKI